MCKFELPGYSGTPSKNSIYFWVEKWNFWLFLVKRICFTIFATDSESSCQTQSKYEVSKDLKVIWKVFKNLLKFFWKKSKMRKTKFLRSLVDPLGLFRSTSNFNSRRENIFWEKSPNLMKIVQELQEKQGKYRGGDSPPHYR